MAISIARDGQQIGEWTEDQVRAFRQAGQLLDTDSYWREGMTEWRPLGSLVGAPPPLISAAVGTAAARHSTITRVARVAWKIVVGALFLWLCNSFPVAVHAGFVGAGKGFLVGLIPMMVAHNYAKLPKFTFHLFPAIIAGALGDLWFAVPVAVIQLAYLVGRGRTAR